MSGFGIDQNSSRKEEFACGGRRSAAMDRGYSLLELMIVLVVLVGLLAFAWPSLSKPLANSDLQQAATQLRTHLAEARLSAMQKGEPVLVRIEHGSGILTHASWHQTMMPVTVNDYGTEAEGSETEIVDPTGDVEDAGNRNVGESWVLPEGIIVDAVTHEGPRSDENESPSFLEGEREFSSDVLDLPEENSSMETDAFDEDSDNSDLRTSWIWFLPQGQASGASIRLIDTHVQRELTLQIQAWNGAIILEKAQPIPSEDETGAAEFDELYSREDALNDRKSGSYGGEDSTVDAF